MAARVFISFDYDNDRDLKELLVGQAKHPDSPFEITDASVKYHLTGDWQEKVKGRIKRADQVIVLCGKQTDKATGVSLELMMARDLRSRTSCSAVVPVAATRNRRARLLPTWSSPGFVDT